ncbi:GNAT family N-acetyltransferase [Clostridium sp. DL1XJH146]
MNCFYLRYKDLKGFKSLYYKFDNHEIDFFKAYSSSNVYKKILLRKSVLLLKKDNKYIGYIWINQSSHRQCSIIERNIMKKYNKKISYEILLSKLTNIDNIIYKTKKYDYTNFSLITLGYCNYSTIYEMELNLQSDFIFKERETLRVRFFKKSYDEKIRCLLQNSIFEKKDRKQLSIRDIYYDEIQDYYYEKGVLFLLKNNIEIGLGQIIKEKSILTLVNFGILKEHRGNGYGKYLLTYMLNYLKAKGEKKIILRVDAKNDKAINLYTSMGFVIKSEYYSYTKFKINEAVE